MNSTIKLKQRKAFQYTVLLVFSMAIQFAGHDGIAQENVTTVSRNSSVLYRNTVIDGTRIAYRIAGDPGKPALILLHGFPSSSHMFRDLIESLEKDFYLIAPDYPGFGRSDAPRPGEFAYTFENISLLVEKLLNELAIKKMYLYVHDYGGPIGFRIASRNPSRIEGLIIQNANAYNEGWGPAATGLRNYIEDPSEENRLSIAMFLTLAGTKFQYYTGAADTSRINPDGFMLDQYYLDRPGNQEIQYSLFRDYKSNLQLYPAWQAYFRKQQPKTLILWGKNDPIFTIKGAQGYKRDLPDSKLYFYDGGHFLLAEIPGEIGAKIKSFIQTTKK